MKRFAVQNVQKVTPRAISYRFQFSDSEISKAYDELMNSYTTSEPVNDYVLVDAKYVDVHVDNYLSNQDLNALGNVVKTYTGLTNGTVQKEDIDLRYFKDTLELFIQVSTYVVFKARNNNTEDYKLAINEFKNYIKKLGYGFSDGYLITDDVTEIKPLLGFIQFIIFGITQIFTMLNVLEELTTVNLRELMEKDFMNTLAVHNHGIEPEDVNAILA